MRDFSQTSDNSENNSRTLLLFDSLEKIVSSLQVFFDTLAASNQMSIKGAIIGEKPLFQNKKFNKIINAIQSFPNVKKYNSSEVISLLGSTHHFIVLDLTQIFDPNKLILTVETVIGGGIILLLGEKFDVWVETVNKHRFSYSRKSNLLTRFLTEIKKNKNLD